MSVCYHSGMTIKQDLSEQVDGNCLIAMGFKLNKEQKKGFEKKNQNTSIHPHWGRCFLCNRDICENKK